MTAALHGFDPAYVSFGSKRELPSSGPMSASAGCGHAVALGHSLLEQAQVLGAPTAAVQRAIQISRQPDSQRAGPDGEDGGIVGAGLCAGAAAGRGGPTESLCRISCWSACSLAISPPIWP
jgi:hypothetical protein